MSDLIDDVPWFMDSEIKEGTKIVLEVLVWFGKGIAESAYVLSGMKSLMEYKLIDDEPKITYQKRDS